MSARWVLVAALLVVAGFLVLAVASAGRVASGVREFTPATSAPAVEYQEATDD